MFKMFQAKEKKVTKQPLILTQESKNGELFEELDDADLLTVVGGIEATGSISSPGFVSSNVVQIPASLPVNAGNSVVIGGVVNPAFGDSGVNVTAEL
ncbi:MAG: chaplin [Brasilonema octagenarum HA4186-MV1]|jgi:hypothetical protein|nr:chaplin [Brasilonema octagenarum HA4186-MV1]